MANTFQRSEFYLTATLVVATVALFWPVIAWIGQETLAHEQLRQSLALMAFAAIFVLFDQWGRLKAVFDLSNGNLALLFASFGLASTALLWPNPYTILGALGVAVLALARILFGARALPLYLPLVVTFAAFLLFILFLPLLDWPLRALAGHYASGFLETIGFGSVLHLAEIPLPTLLMVVEGRPFEVAAECNGFGLMTTAVLLALLLAVSQPMPIWWKVAAVILAGAIGFGFNIVRIVGIVLMAPLVPDHYDLMHEVVGLTALFAGLATVWLLTGFPAHQIKADR
jgi:exosortase/archaeosortase family protein